MLAEYPKPVASRDAPQLELDLDYVQTIVTRTRKLRSDYGLVKQKPKLFLTTIDAGGPVDGWAGGQAGGRTILGSPPIFFSLPSLIPVPFNCLFLLQRQACRAFELLERDRDADDQQ